MSILKWLQPTKIQEPLIPGLPSPTVATTEEEALKISAANEAIEASMPSPGSRKRKHGEYKTCTPKHAKYAKLAVEIGVAKVAKKLSTQLGARVSDTTIRSMRDDYNKKVKVNLAQPINNADINELPTKIRGRLLLLGQELDSEVKKFIQNVRQAGGVVNSTIVVAATRGIVEAHNRALLSENGWSINLTREYARSLMNRMNLVKRKGTKTARKLPSDFEALKTDYLEKITTCVHEYDVPEELVINFDQTGLKIVPVSEWTLEVKGSKDCSIVALEDKREITAVIGITLSGVFLPLQLVYKGTTDRCHPHFRFPSDWDVTHSENHWSTSETMVEYAKNVLIPYCNNARKMLGRTGRNKAHALAIFDIFKAYQNKDFLALLHKNKMRTVFVPLSTTEELQPCDRTVNGKLKSILKQKFISWYADQVKVQLSKGKPIEEVSVDLKISALKPAHANWLLFAFDSLSKQKQCICDGFRLAGITDALNTTSSDWTN